MDKKQAAKEDITMIDIFESLENDVEDSEPSELELEMDSRAVQREIETWDIVECVRCENNFSMLQCKIFDGSFVCPHCGGLNG